MLDIKLEGLDESVRLIGATHKQLPFATARTLTRLGQMAKKENRAEMRRVFDRPTPFTLNSLQLTPAKKKNLVATLFFKEPTRFSYKQHYLAPQVFGGKRELKRHEQLLGGDFLMPGGGLKRNAYGNVKGSDIVKILSASKAFPERGYKMNIKGKFSKMFRIHNPNSHLPQGIWARVGRGKKHKHVSPLLIAASRSPHYEKRYDLHGTTRRVVEANAERVFWDSFFQAVDTAK